MKKLLLLLFCLVPMFVFGQKIKANKVDDFTGSHIIETSWERLNKGGGGMTSRNHLYFKFTYINSTLVFHLKWATYEHLSVSENSELLLLQKDKTVNKASSIATFHTEIGGGAYSFAQSEAIGVHIKYTGDFSFLKDTSNPLVKLRINSSQGYTDIDIKEGYLKKLYKSYDLIIAEYEKTK